MNLNTLRVASVQMECAAGDKAANFAKIERFSTRRPRSAVCGWCVFPECCITGYWFIRNLSIDQLAALAEPVPAGPSTQRLIALAQRARIDHRRGPGRGRGRRRVPQHLRRRAARRHVASASQAARVRAHRDPQRRRNSPSSTSPDGFRAGVLICYDCNLIENVRITALRGAEVLLAPHQTGGVRSRNPHLMGLIDRAAVGRIVTPIPRRSSANCAATRAAAG